MNSFTTNIAVRQVVPERSSDDPCKPATPPSSIGNAGAIATQGRIVFILIHGIYGSEDTFAKLPQLLLDDYRESSVYQFSYWSSAFLPNFQRLRDLGTEFRTKLEEIAQRSENKDEQIVIIAHSQGGLIAKEAILQLKQDFHSLKRQLPKLEIEASTSPNRDDVHSRVSSISSLLDKITLIMVGTPNMGSLYATYNNIFINSFFAPVTFGLELVQVLPPFVFINPAHKKTWIYNRQAYDMSFTQLKLGHYTSTGDLSPFMRRMIVRWGYEFHAVTDDTTPKVYAIVGVKNMMDMFDLSDGVVHLTTVLFAGVPESRTRYVPYQHFEGEIAINNRCHRSFNAILEILNDTKAVNGQRISPFSHLPISYVTFISDRDRMQDSMPHGQSNGIPLKGSFSVNFRGEQSGGFTNPLERGNFLLSFLKIPVELALLPFSILQGFMQPQDERDYWRTKWVMETMPVEVLGGDQGGHVWVRKKIGEGGWFFGPKTSDGRVDFVITDREEDTAKCQQEYPIRYESDQIRPGKHPTPPRLRILSNSVNFVKIEAFTTGTDRTAKDTVILTVMGCLKA